MAKPLWHVVGAAPVMVLAFRRYGPLPALAAGVGGVMIDGDHLVDWALNGGREDYSRRIVVPLHGWEYPALLLGFAAIARRRRRRRRRQGPEGHRAHVAPDLPTVHVAPDLPTVHVAPDLPATRAHKHAHAHRQEEAEEAQGGEGRGERKPEEHGTQEERQKEERWRRGLIIALAAGWLGHLVLDTLVNHPRTPAGYSLLYRLRHRFRRSPAWLPSGHWQKRHVTNWGPAPGETAIAGTLACIVLLLSSAD